MGRKRKRRNRNAHNTEETTKAQGQLLRAKNNVVTDETAREGNEKKRKRQPSTDETSLNNIDCNCNKLYLTPQDASFEKHIQDHYRGFVHLPVDRLQPPNFHQQAKIALERLRDANYYQYDIVMAGGKHSSRTFVKRTLVGNPGITYKYLGLRLFAHAW